VSEQLNGMRSNSKFTIQGEGEAKKGDGWETAVGARHIARDMSAATDALASQKSSAVTLEPCGVAVMEKGVDGRKGLDAIQQVCETIARAAAAHHLRRARRVTRRRRHRQLQINAWGLGSRLNRMVPRLLPAATHLRMRCSSKRTEQRRHCEEERWRGAATDWGMTNPAQAMERDDTAMQLHWELQQCT
jgi:hypothetical protein